MGLPRASARSVRVYEMPMLCALESEQLEALRSYEEKHKKQTKNGVESLKSHQKQEQLSLSMFLFLFFGDLCLR